MSVLTQTFKDFEVVVVDDASNDNTREVVQGFTDARIRYIQHEKNMGGSAARNTGIKSSLGKYIAFLDDDDEWLPEKLQLQVDLLEKSPLHIGVVYTAYHLVAKDSGNSLGIRIPSKTGNLSRSLLKKNWVGSTSSVLIRKTCFERVGLFDESLPSCQDYDLWIRISKEFHFMYISKPLVVHHDHKVRISNNMEALCKGVDVMLKKHKIPSFAMASNFGYVRYVEIGTLYCCQNNMTEARKAYSCAIKMYPLGIKAYLGLCLTLLGPKTIRRLIDFPI